MAIRSAMLLLTILASASTARAESVEKFNWKPLAAFGAGQMFDVWTTQVAIGRGCVERNTFTHGTPRPSAGRLVLGKTMTAAPVAVAAVVLQRTGHRKIASALGYSGAAAGVGVGIRNLSLDCRR